MDVERRGAVVAVVIGSMPGGALGARRTSCDTRGLVIAAGSRPTRNQAALAANDGACRFARLPERAEAAVADAGVESGVGTHVATSPLSAMSTVLSRA